MSEGKTLDFDPNIQKTQKLTELVSQLTNRSLGITKERTPDLVELEPEAHTKLQHMRNQTASNKKEYHSLVCTQNLDPSSGIDWNTPVYQGTEDSIPPVVNEQSYKWAKDNQKGVIGNIHTHPSTFKRNRLKYWLLKLLQPAKESNSPVGFSASDIRFNNILVSKAPIALLVTKNYNYLLIPSEFTRASRSFEKVSESYYSPGMELPKDSKLKHQINDIEKKIYQAYQRNDEETAENLEALNLHLSHGFEVYRGKIGKPLQRMKFQK